MKRLLRALLLALVTSLATGAFAQGSVKDLAERLQNGADFRVRVQAALELGKSRSAAARRPLERGLEDDNAAVRAAAAAGLKVLGDPAALDALKRRKNDSSDAVRSQILASIAALEGVRDQPKEQIDVLIEIGPIKNGASGGKTVAQDLEKLFRDKLQQLPGVEVLDEGASSKSEGKARKLPVVKVTGRLSKLDESREGSSVVYSVRVEFVVHKMPESAITSTVSGTARASASATTARDQRKREALRQEALLAAVDSALRRAPDALRAATQ